MPYITYWKCRTKRKMIYKVVDENTCNDWNYKEHMKEKGWEQITKKEYKDRI